MKKTLLLCSVFLLLFSFTASQAETAGTFPAKISALVIKGIKNTSEKEIRSVIFVKSGDSLNPEKIQSDVKAIYALGYFSDVASSLESTPKGTKVTYNLIENPKITNISLQGNSVISTNEMISIIGSKQGAVENFSRIQEDIEKINELYKQRGFMLSHVASVDLDKKTGILSIIISEGRVEAIVLSGNESTKDYVILREFNTKQGAVLNEETLKKDLRRVFNLGFFSEVTPNFESGSTKDKVVLNLKIKETRSSTINFGGGYGEREGMFGFADLSINNLLGTGQGVLLRGQSGQQLSTYQFRYTNPWVLPDKFGDHTALTFRRWLTVGRDILLAQQDGIYNGWDISLGKPLQENLNIIWTIGREHVEPYSAATFEAYVSDTVGLTLAYDTRDFWLNPKSGRYYTLDLKQGWKFTDSVKTNFTKIGIDLNHYLGVTSNQVFASHFGVAAGLGDVPYGDKYWAGGANTIRGYTPAQARIGKRKILLNLEYRMDFSDAFQGVFFYDYGNAWDSGWPDFPMFLSGWGPGIRFTTPLGPIRLDYGVPAGGSWGDGQLHFSIGQAF
ncbi:MAG: BamA/TamA family outer membrane protein [Candidatus Margulisiibacteriota bacterium]